MKSVDDIRGITRNSILCGFVVIFSFSILAACTPLVITSQPTAAIPSETITSKIQITARSEPVILATRTLTQTLTIAPTSTPEPESTATPTITVTGTVTVTVTPTYSVLRGVVNQGHVNCYYGPSKAYLYKYGLLKGNRLDIIDWLPDTGYIEVQAMGGDNPCWMNREFMDINGDINLVKPVDPQDIRLPRSPYYPALAYAKAERSGNEVTVTWSPLKLKAGDSSEQEPYLMEAWVCRGGKFTFVPVGAYQNQAKVVDEPGCGGQSHARVYGVEKHGYTKYLEFDWPQAGE